MYIKFCICKKILTFDLSCMIIGRCTLIMCFFHDNLTRFLVAEAAEGLLAGRALRDEGVRMLRQLESDGLHTRLHAVAHGPTGVHPRPQRPVAVRSLHQQADRAHKNDPGRHNENDGGGPVFQLGWEMGRVRKKSGTV